MSDLKPRGVPVMVEGVERHFLFTLNVIDEIQDHYNLALSEVIDKLTDKSQAYKTLRYIIMTLLNDEAERENATGNDKYKKVTEKETGWLITLENEEEILIAVFKAYGLSLPEGEDEYPNQEGREITG